MSSQDSLDEYLAGLRRVTEDALHRALTTRGTPPVVGEPMRYSLLGGGKRLRPCLTLAAADTVAPVLGLDLDLGTARLLALPGAVAVEMIHSYSLVHDDLPAMDNDDLRRGRPTTHIVHGDGLAILAGDGLLTDAFAVVAAETPVVANAPVADASRRLHAVRVLAEAAGSAGMVGGQAIDLAAVGRIGNAEDALGPDALENMHARKTGALIRASSVLGAILAGAGQREIQALDRYAAELGLAFQIVDDILDIEGSNVDLGKTAGKDAAAGKPTFPALYGLERSKQMAAACIDRAEEALDGAALGGRLRELARWSLARKS